MDNVIFHLIEPCENTFQFEVECKGYLSFTFVDRCKVNLLFEEVCEPYIVANYVQICEVNLIMEELQLCPELVFNWTCQIGEDYLYLVTTEGYFFKTLDNKYFILKKI